MNNFIIDPDKGFHTWMFVGEMFRLSVISHMWVYHVFA